MRFHADDFTSFLLAELTALTVVDQLERLGFCRELDRVTETCDGVFSQRWESDVLGLRQGLLESHGLILRGEIVVRRCLSVQGF